MTLLGRVFDEAGGDNKPRCRPPWRVSGWFQDTVEWVVTALITEGLSLVAPICQERSTCQSAVLSCTVQKTAGMAVENASERNKTVYIKAALPDFPEAKCRQR